MAGDDRVKILRALWLLLGGEHRHATRRFRGSPTGKRRFNPLLRQAGRIPHRWLEDGLECVLASARKPG